jgi:ABC-type bacteriocin/lantibiotic exporter with double-glycine peptidase domain
MAADAAAPSLLDRFPALARLGLGRGPHIPFMQQLTGTECGAACLAMVLGFHGRTVSLEQVRDACGAGRDGVTARQIIEAGELFHLRGRGVKLDADDLALLTPGATILHWEFQHFVVLARVGPTHVEIVDPAVGRRKLPLDEVRRAFTGVALLFEPTDLFRVQAGPATLVPAIKRLVLGSGLLRRIVAVSLVMQVTGLALPVLTGQVIDRVLPRGDLGLLAVLLLGLGAMVLFRALGELVRGHLLMHLRTLLDARLTLGFLDHLVTLPLSFFQNRSAGDLLMRLNSNAIVRERLTATALTGMLDGLMVVLYIAILLLGSGPMAAAALIAGGLEVAVFLLVRHRHQLLASEQLQAEARAQGYEVEMLTAMETLKATGCEQRAVAHWSNLFVDQLNVQLQRERLNVKTGAVLESLRTAGPLAVLAIGAHQVLAGRLTLGGMLALAAVAAGFLEPLSRLVQTLLSLETVRGYLRRVADVLSAEPEQPREGLQLAPGLAGQVTLDGVSFRYHPHAPLAVDGVSVDITPGQFVAIVGRSGSGKTTLANLILGLAVPGTGRVLYDGRDARSLDLRSVRRQFGVVNQNLGLFGLSIRDNISLADPGLPLADVERAARLAAIHDDIAALPLGYNTPLSDRGGAISGGQRQRLALARALVRRPAVLLLDEATSALDAATERQVQQSLGGLACTRLVIAHRLSTIRRADLILVMDGGRIVESGDHQTLLANGGAYASLIAAQLEVPDPG